MTFRSIRARWLAASVRAYCETFFVLHLARNKDKQVLFFPEFPGRAWYVAPKYLRYCGILATPFMRPRTWEASGPLLRRFLLKRDRASRERGITYIIFCFEDNTRSQVDPQSYLRSRDRFPVNLHLLNHRCNDISKSRVDAVHRDIFGYGLAVDPLVFKGNMVEKSDLNGRHDGVIVLGPLKPEEVKAGSVYQRLIDTESSGEVTDLRVAVFGTTLALVYRKTRPARDRFSNTNTRATILPAAEVFSEPERLLIARFAGAMGLDAGELDILRDRDSQHLYVVDVNKTVSGPPNHLGIRDTLRAIGLLGQSFQAAILDHLGNYRP